jgi:hypothetical protein
MDTTEAAPRGAEPRRRHGPPRAAGAGLPARPAALAPGGGLGRPRTFAPRPLEAP